MNGRADRAGGKVAEPFVVDFDHHSGDYLDDKLTAWHGLRATPVARSERYGGFWVVSGYDEVNRVSRDERVFTSEFGERAGLVCQGIAGIPRPRGIPPVGIAEAPPRLHQELRRVLLPYLLPDAMRTMRPFAETLTKWFVDEKIESGGMDFVDDLTNPVPAILTLRLIGLPTDRWRHYAAVFHAMIAHQPGTAAYDAAVALVPAMMESLFEEVRQRRSEPRQDLLTALVQLRDDEGQPLADNDIQAVLWNLIGGGLDTTTSLTSLSLFHLGTHPGLRAQLLAHRDWLPTATEEFLRYYSISETLTRTVTEDVDLGGRHLSRGDVVLISWLSANHDQTRFARAGDVVLDRTPNPHLAFGVGTHRCVGMHMARMVYQVMLNEILDRLPDYEVDVASTRFYEGNPLLAGVVTLPATFSPGARVGPAVLPV